MIHLDAFAPEDGWALVSSDEGRWLIQPPYRPADRRRITDDVAARVVFEDRLPARDEAFENWGALTRQLIDERRALETNEDRLRTRDAAERVLRRSSIDDVAQHLHVVRSWIDDRRLREAQRALIVLLSAHAVQHAPESIQAIQTMLGEVAELQDAPLAGSGVGSTWRVKNAPSVSSQEGLLRTQGTVLTHKQAS